MARIPDNEQVSNAQKKSLRTADPATQFQRDIAVWDAYLSDKTPSPGTEQRKDVIKRLFLALENTHLQFRSPGNKEFSSVADRNQQLADNQLPLASLLSHGGRIVLQIPPVANEADQDKFFNWIVGGKENIADDAKQSDEQGRAVFHRPVATHSIEVTESGVTELRLKGGAAAIQDAPTLLSDYAHNRHFGMNVGLGEPNAPAKEDGQHGHLYMYWVPPTKTTPGALMVGVEGSAPGCESYYGAAHGPQAVRGEFSPTGGLKFSDKQFNGYSIRPDSVDGVKVELTEKDLKELLSKNEKAFDLQQLGKPAGEKQGVNVKAEQASLGGMGAPSMMQMAKMFGKEAGAQVKKEVQTSTAMMQSVLKRAGSGKVYSNPHKLKVKEEVSENAISAKNTSKAPEAKKDNINETPTRKFR